MELIDILRFQIDPHIPMCDDEREEPEQDSDDEYEAWANGDDRW